MRNFAIILLMSITPILTSYGQNSTNKIPDIVQNKGITTPLHKANVGKITFMSNIIPLEEYRESDFLSSFEIEENSDLNIRVFLGNSLTNYLHQLDTTLTVDELVKKGNYQFSFYVDGDLLYTENLNSGAGLPHQKNENTILRKPLLSSTNEDSWGRFLWMRFYYRNGGEAALESGTHVLKIEIRPYLDNDGIIVGDLIAQGEINLKLAEPGQVAEEQIAIQPIQPNSGWELSKDRYDKEKIRELNQKIAQNKFKNITSVVVIKDGKLLIEEYFNGANRNTLHDTRSVGKSFASTMTGIALEEDYLKSTSQSLSEFYDLTKFSNYSAKKDKVTIKSLLTMSSGFVGSDDNYDSPGNEEKMYPTDNWVRFTLDLPMDDTKKIGEKWDYFTAGVVVLGDIIDKSVPGGLEKYADKKLFKPLGISNYKWQYTPQNVANTAGGLQMNALDFAKYGQLYKNKGTWDGRQVLPSDWVKKTMTNYFMETPDQTPYGFLFWNQKFSVNDKSYEAFLCNGNGGNKVIVFNDQPLVIVITATAYGQPYGHSQVDKMIQRYILPAVLE
ncbi:serine hydrolase domain-containing protein [Xanthovirga aplysinae]|uniref:serine hydrolase domain-containing protein n=1 Tax=Xanthovirga aplysinae TaxID=2529853 RepID=UPI0012BBDE12|nr:serine hydrolase [Xanthovirga aplysinae]MTI30456.1 class C beta-lactamase-related serine hydrolase [Xanthovirga aplysinae]